MTKPRAKPAPRARGDASRRAAADAAPTAAPIPFDARKVSPDPRHATTIGAGETFQDVARRLGVRPDALFEANRDVLGSNTARAAVGTPLLIPGTQPAPRGD